MLGGMNFEVLRFQILMDWSFDTGESENLIHQKVQLCYFLYITATNRDKDYIVIIECTNN